MADEDPEVTITLKLSQWLSFMTAVSKAFNHDKRNRDLFLFSREYGHFPDQIWMAIKRTLRPFRNQDSGNE